MKKIISIGIIAIIILSMVGCSSTDEYYTENGNVYKKPVEEETNIIKSKVTTFEYEVKSYDNEKIPVKFEIWTETEYDPEYDLYHNQILYIKNLSDEYISVSFSYENNEKFLSGSPVSVELDSLRNDKNDVEFLGNGNLHEDEANRLAPNEVGIMGESHLDVSMLDDYNPETGKYHKRYYAFEGLSVTRGCERYCYIDDVSEDGGISVTTYGHSPFKLSEIHVDVYNEYGHNDVFINDNNHDYKPNYNYAECIGSETFKFDK